MLSNNPTRTLSIEKAWRREINKRWSALWRDMKAGFTTEFTVNALELSAGRIDAYIRFLESRIEALITRGDWQAKYQIQAYLRGIERSRAELKAQGAVLTPTPLDAALQFQTTVTPALIAGGRGVLPLVHTEALAFLQTRAYESLKGWTDKFSTEARQILVDGAAAGQNPRVIAKLLQERLGVSAGRARTIAQTEVIQAFQRSQIVSADLAAEEIGEPVQMRWVTRLDERVRPLHASWHGLLSTPEAARAKINQSPVNCRCAIIPVISEADTPARRDKYAAERKQLLKTVGEK